jgi:5'-nucleotidase
MIRVAHYPLLRTGRPGARRRGALRPGSGVGLARRSPWIVPVEPMTTTSHAQGPYLPGERNVPRERRIYVNRNLRMDRIRAIGFDMDHTLALYNRAPFEQLTFEMALENLVKWKKYPEEVLAIKYDPDFVIRGLVVDKRLGNILKMDFHNYIARAYHGTQPLSKEEKRRCYRGSKINLRNERYQSFDSLFSLPEGSMFAAIVDRKAEDHRGALRDIPLSQIFGDVRACVDKVHRDGSLKSVIMRDPSLYFMVDEQLAPTLQRFRARGKKLFLVTNSEHDYTEAVMSYLLTQHGKDWKSLFDLVIVSSQKPQFFTEKPPAQPLIINATARRRDFVFGGANAAFVEEYLGANGDQVLYFGDHTYGDILRSKKTVGWRTAMIVQELEQAIAINESQVYLSQEMTDLVARRKDVARDREETTSLVHTMEEIADTGPGRRNGIPPWASPAVRRELEAFQSRSAAEQRETVEYLRSTMRGLDFLMDQTVAHIRYLESTIDRAHNPYWGHLFREGNEISRFGRQLKEFACIYSSRVSNFLNYPVECYFIAPDERLPHEV